MPQALPREIRGRQVNATLIASTQCVYGVQASVLAKCPVEEARVAICIGLEVVGQKVEAGHGSLPLVMAPSQLHFLTKRKTVGSKFATPARKIAPREAAR